MHGAFTIRMAMSGNGVRIGMENIPLKSQLTLLALPRDKNASGVGEPGGQRRWNLDAVTEAVVIPRLHFSASVFASLCLVFKKRFSLTSFRQMPNLRKGDSSMLRLNIEANLFSVFFSLACLLHIFGCSSHAVKRDLRIEELEPTPSYVSIRFYPEKLSPACEFEEIGKVRIREGIFNTSPEHMFVNELREEVRKVGGHALINYYDVSTYSEKVNPATKQVTSRHRVGRSIGGDAIRFKDASCGNLEEQGTFISSAVLLSNVQGRRLRFFEGEKDLPAKEKRIYKTNFIKAETRYICWEINLNHPNLSKRIDFDIEAVWSSTDGGILRRQVKHSYVEPTWKNSYH